MESKTLRVFLRVLYTVNSSPQYILAKSSSQVPAIICNETAARLSTSDPAYARAPLKACLAAVCDSSPELLQDHTRDFSLYFLDPLETQPAPTGLAPTLHNAGSPRGVAVALGLMSWALESNESTNVFVTGTIIPNASPALEVVCALRETKRMQKPVLHSYPLGATSALGSSYPLNHLYSSQTAWMSWLSTSHLHRDQLPQQTLTRSADFPEHYIGPPRRARGRPEGTTSSKSKRKVQPGASTVPADSSSGVVGTPPESKEAGRKRKQMTKPRPSRAPPTHSPFVCAPLTRNTTVSGSGSGIPVFNPQSNNQSQVQSRVEPDPQAQVHNPLSGLLSAVSSTSGNASGNTASEQQATLLSVLQGLLTANPHLLQLAAASTEVLPTVGEKTAQEVQEGSNADDDGDSDIVILDSSTIDTTIFRKPSVSQRPTSDHDTPSLTGNQGLPMPVDQSISSSPLPASTPPSGQENTSTSSQTSTPIGALELTAEAPTSKHVPSGWAGKGGGDTSHALEMPATPSSSRKRKRKLEEYIKGQAHTASPTPPPSPSPSMAHTSSVGRATITKHRTLSSPTDGTKSGSTQSVRLPSVLSSIRGAAHSGSRSQVSSSPTSRGNPVASTNHGNGNQPSALFLRPPEPKAEHARITNTPPDGSTSDTISLKRRRTLTEFMAEQEARKCARVRNRSSSRHKLRAEMSGNAPGHANFVLASRLAQSSPRPRFRSDPMVSAPISTSQLGSVPGAVFLNPASSTVTFAPTSSFAFPSTAPQTKNPLKNYVVPAWARTDTAMLPRLSDEALARQNAERETKKAQVSLRRREAAKEKRKRLHRADRPSRESSDEDEDEATMNDARGQTPHYPSAPRVAQSTLLPSLPVFASDAVEPILSSPPRSHRQLAAPIIPRTPPRKSVSSSAPGTDRTPSKSGSCPLFSPSGQDPMSLFTPRMPSITRSLTRATFTPRSPTVLRHSGSTKKSPRKSVLQTPKRGSGDRPTPMILYTDRNLAFASPGIAPCTPQTRTRTQTQPGTRAFLLPPPSPCAALQTPQRPRQVPSKASGDSNDPRILQSPSALGAHTQQSAEQRDQGEDCNDEVLVRELDDALRGADATLPPTPRYSDSGEGEPQQHTTSASDDVTGTSHGEGERSYARCASSPLPPSSPPPTSPCSSPVWHPDRPGTDTTHENTAALAHAHVDLPPASDADANALWLLSDDNAWFTDADASVSAWLTETEAWLTDADTSEGGGRAPLTDSDGVSNWLSDVDVDAGVEPDESKDEIGNRSTTAEGEDDSVLDTSAFQRAYAALVERAVRTSEGKGGGVPASPAGWNTGAGEAELWASMQPLLDGEGEGKGTLGGDATSATEATPDVQALLDGLSWITTGS